MPALHKAAGPHRECGLELQAACIAALYGRERAFYWVQLKLSSHIELILKAGHQDSGLCFTSVAVWQLTWLQALQLGMSPGEAGVPS